MKKPSELQRLRALPAAFDRRPKRERWLMLGAAMALLLALADAVWIGPAWRGYKLAQGRLAQADKALAQTRQLKAQNEQEQAVAQQQRAAEIQALQQQLQALQGQPGALEGARMLAVLEELVQRQGSALSLRALSALPAAAPAASASPPCIDTRWNWSWWALMPLCTAMCRSWPRPSPACGYAAWGLWCTSIPTSK